MRINDGCAPLRGGPATVGAGSLSWLNLTEPSLIPPVFSFLSQAKKGLPSSWLWDQVIMACIQNKQKNQEEVQFTG